MSNNQYTAPDELITGGHVTKECNSVTVLFDDIHYSLSSGQLNGGFHHTLGVRNQQLTCTCTMGRFLITTSDNGYCYEEKDGEFHTPGTINILVFTNKALTDSAMVKAIMTITEAKTAALQDWKVESTKDLPKYNTHIVHSLAKETNTSATGTATDGIILTINANGDVLTDAGSYSLFGDTLAKAVYLGVQRALENAIGTE